MAANPKPLRDVAFDDGKGAMIVSDARGPEDANFFEMKRWMPRILKPQPKSLPRKALNPGRELPEPATKASCR
jgi:hypothetical protein